MTTIAVVRKNGYAAIAADTLTKWGSGKESAAYVANSTKIVRVGDSYIAGSGTSTFKLILRDYFAQRGVPARFDSAINLFKTWQAFHAVLKERYYLVSVGDKDDTIESSKFDVLIANPHGIFGVGAHRTVQEYRKSAPSAPAPISRSEQCTVFTTTRAFPPSRWRGWRSRRRPSSTTPPACRSSRTPSRSGARNSLHVVLIERLSL